MKKDAGPGVPEALPRALRFLADRLGAESVDRLWIFPPLIRGRREQGLVAVSCFLPDAAAGGEEDGGRRRLFTVPYTAERTGQGLTLEHDVREEGEAPGDRLPRVMDGVVRRSGDELGEPREVRIGGDPAALAALASEYETAVTEIP